ncbi:hypothetical protein QR98_0009110 [Sarcoptes scabiei]|uniref:Uncharacterized protein n=1 Tax=Sarcoptes scabiei TaxID=52283 RepID=A0A131ZUR9_SARSC|nr:hypothetical protein QR98_0009110 [Sarcoptes scabiei]
MNNLFLTICSIVLLITFRQADCTFWLSKNREVNPLYSQSLYPKTYGSWGQNYYGPQNYGTNLGWRKSPDNLLQRIGWIDEPIQQRSWIDSTQWPSQRNEPWTPSDIVITPKIYPTYSNYGWNQGKFYGKDYQYNRNRYQYGYKRNYAGSSIGNW